jgi:hypothetical protein
VSVNSSGLTGSRDADAYLAARTGCFEMRCERYDAALEVMHGLGLDDSCTVLDVGAGMGEFGARLHAGAGLWDEDWDGNRYSCEGVSRPLALATSP